MLRRIAFIVFAQKIGLSLDEIGAELAKLPPTAHRSVATGPRLSTTWRTRIRERIAELERLERGLTRCIGCGCLSLKQCQLSNPGDQAHRLGPGPRYWISERP